MIKMNNYFEIKEAITRSKDIVIASHVSPDGDNLGSTLGLYLALKKIGKNVKILKVDTIPENYLFMDGLDEIVELEEDTKVETFIALDCADINRLGINKNIALNADQIINIDHHISNTKYGHLNLIESDSSSTGELIYNLLVEMKIELDQAIANCIYIAISSDTGSFRYSNTTARTHEIVGKLYEVGVDAANINIELYQSTSLNKFNLFNRAMSEIEFCFDNKVGIVLVTEEMVEKAGASMEDTEGLVESVRDIKCVELAILLKEKENETKISMRSKKVVNVSELCSEFGGGGHIRASGATIKANIRDAKVQVMEKVEKYI